MHVQVNIISLKLKSSWGPQYAYLAQITWRELHIWRGERWGWWWLFEEDTLMLLWQLVSCMHLPVAFPAQYRLICTT